MSARYVVSKAVSRVFCVGMLLTLVTAGGCEGATDAGDVDSDGQSGSADGGGSDGGGDGADGAGEGDSGADAEGDGGSDGGGDGADSAGDGGGGDEGDDAASDEGGGDGSDGGSSDAAFEINAEISSAIATVTIVEWSVDLADIESAYIEYGLDDDYGMQAPVDLEEDKYRTLLLGMKPSQSYHFRVVVEAGGERYRSADQVIDTGPFPNRLSIPDMETPLPDELDRGFTVTSIANDAEAIIVDADGDYVWWFGTDLELLSRARMSWDSKYMWLRDGNPKHEKGSIIRVSMDGLDVKTWENNTSHHDLVPLEEGGIAYIDENGSCDDIYEMTDEGEATKVISVADYVGPGFGECQVNSLHYTPSDDAYTMSLRSHGMYIKVSRSGELIWILGGSLSDFPGVAWDKNVQHGHHVIDGGLLLFNNADGSVSPVIEYALDEGSMQAEEVWSYAADYGSIWLGDVQRLDNGNTLIVYAADGVMLELNPDDKVVQRRSWPIGAGLGYAMRRASLYGPPPK